MLSNQHFYHRTMRKMVVAFGTMFNNIRLVRYNKTNTVEIERITVPLAYASKEKFYQRITQDPELTKETQITLPRMGFELASITYDPLRKISNFNTQFSPGSSYLSAQSVLATPYNFEFNLNIYVRNVEDGTQIIEQILPYFAPDYTVNANIAGLSNLNIDIPIILNSVSQTEEAQGSAEDLRLLNWSLNFTMKGYFYGPTSNSKIITKSTANTFYFNTSNDGAKIITLNSGSGNFKIGELVYEGTTLNKANGSAFVESWNPAANILTVVDTTGIIKVGKTLRGAVTGSAWNINTYAVNDYKLANITVVPDPPTANANDDYGFTTTITEFV